MIRHIVRLLWNRKRHNVLIGLEIFISYLVLFGVMCRMRSAEFAVDALGAEAGT